MTRVTFVFTLLASVGACEAGSDAMVADVSAVQRPSATASDSLACTKEVPATMDAAKRTLAIADCQNRRRALRTVSIDMQYVGEQMSSVPEYHDEQRLTTAENTFGPMSYIFASPSVGGFANRWQLEEHGTRGALWAIVLVDTAEKSALPSTYTELGLQAGGRNCLWLSIEGGTYKARVTHQLERDQPCNPGAPSRPLHVAIDPLSAVNNLADQPPVARFSQTQGGRPLLGARCFNHWCEFGPMPTSAGGPPTWVPAPVPIAGGTVNAASPVHARVKGWNDFQTLSTGSGASLRPAGPRATFIPVPGLADRPSSYYAGEAWRAVASLHILGPVTGTQYETWGIRQGRNLLSLRMVSGAWQMQVSNTSGTRVWTNVRRHEHFDAAVPGTARFRWISYDDGFWIPCGQGCCRADGV